MLTRYSNNEGFTLMEVLVAVVVLSIGLLGLANLQTVGMKSNNSAYLRTQATLLAYDMADRMRANIAGVTANAYNAISSKPSDPGCLASGCTPGNLAVSDAFQWYENLSVVLPSGTGTVTGAGRGSVFTITVMWDDARTGATGTGCSGDENVDLKCFVMRTQL